jgi:hypothetical protein
MKYELDTIPVWDAIKADTECPFCLLERRSRQLATRYFLGPSVMVPEVRVEVNSVGFSSTNARILSKDPNRLGLALLSQTRFRFLRMSLQKIWAPFLKAPKKISKKNLTDVIDRWNGLQNRCLIQEKIDADLKRYAFTFLHLSEKDPDFRQAYEKSKATCLVHAFLVMTMAKDNLNDSELASFLAFFLAKLEKELERVDEDLLAFIHTFDSTGSHETPGNPKQALERGLMKLYGIFPEYEEESKTYRGALMGL